MGTDKTKAFSLRSDGELAYSADMVLDVFPNLILKVDILLSKSIFVQNVSAGLCKIHLEVALFPKSWPLLRKPKRTKQA